MKEIDRLTIEEFKISDELLMENAGFEIVNSFLRDFSLSGRERIAVICGGGNNGGDGFVIARHLRRRGFQADVFLLTKRERLQGIALLNYERLSFFGVTSREVSEADDFERFKEDVVHYDYLFDALLGIGFRGSPKGTILQAIEFINSCGIPVISVDMPSGVDADGMQEECIAVRATTTYTVGLLKYGLVDYPGKDFAGDVKVVDIGFPPASIERVAGESYFIDRSLANSFVPERRADSHKGIYGHLGVVGGTYGYEGASLLAARAAARSGCGLVTIFLSPESRVQKPDHVIAGYLPDRLESITEEVDLNVPFARCDTLLVGPGMGLSTGAFNLLRGVLKLGKKLLIDADGLNNLSKDKSILKDVKGEVVITPHIGEMSRLSGKSKEEIKRNKRDVAREFSRDFGVTVVLKDAVSVVATPDGKIFFNNGGVSSLSKGGSGDVLSGIIASLMARGLSGQDAAVAGVYLHTECGRIAEERKYEDCVHAGDLVEFLPEAFRRMRDKGRSL
jgi:NAD(P)H-hydrate epimerase